MKQILVAVAVSAMLTGAICWDLDLQKPYEYDYEIGMFNNETKMTAWEFIQSRPDLFSVLIEGVQYAGMERQFQAKELYLPVVNEYRACLRLLQQT